MSALTFGAVVVIVLAAFVGGYVWGWLNGSASAAADPQECRDKLRATERAAGMWRNHAVQLEDENKALRRERDEIENGLTATTKILLEAIDDALAGATVSAGAEHIRDLEGATTS